MGTLEIALGKGKPHVILDVPAAQGTSIQRLDGRTRVLAALLGSVAPLAWADMRVLGAYAVGAAALCVLAAVPARTLLIRIAAVNGFMIMLIALLPWTVPGESVAEVAGFRYSREGLQEALVIALRGNAILLVLTAFIGTMEPHAFGHALARLRVPQKLTVLLLFTVRYIAVLEKEYRQLRRAMAMRAFRPKLNGHTLRTIGYLTGMLLVRALDRSERINEAMRCRGFNGQFPVWQSGRFRAADGLFAIGFTVAIVAFWAAEFAGRA